MESWHLQENEWAELEITVKQGSKANILCFSLYTQNLECMCLCVCVSIIKGGKQGSDSNRRYLL